MQNRIDVSKLELTETIVNIRRVAKTVKGGRNMRFSVTVVVGDGEGHVGVGLGKAQEIPEAVRVGRAVRAPRACLAGRAVHRLRADGNWRNLIRPAGRNIRARRPHVQCRCNDVRIRHPPVHCQSDSSILSQPSPFSYQPPPRRAAAGP